MTEIALVKSNIREEIVTSKPNVIYFSIKMFPLGQSFDSCYSPVILSIVPSSNNM